MYLSDNALCFVTVLTMASLSLSYQPTGQHAARTYQASNTIFDWTLAPSLNHESQSSAAFDPIKRGCCLCGKSSPPLAEVYKDLIDFALVSHWTEAAVSVHGKEE